MSEGSVPGLVEERDGGVLWLRIDREQATNTVDEETRDRLIWHFRQADEDKSTRVIVLTGTGRYFCTGADLAGGMKKLAAQQPAGAAAPRSPLELRRGVGRFQELVRTLWNMETPIVAAVNGTVAGAGLPLCFACDLIVAVEGAQFRSLFVEGGMVPHVGDPYVLPRVFPFHRLMEFALLRDRFTAEDMLAWNTINRVVPADKLEETAREIAGKLASGPTLTLGQTKRLYRRSIEAGLDEMLADEAMTLGAVSLTRDRQEGVKALMERRRTEFVGE